MLTRAHHQRIIRACIYLPTLSAQKLEISESESVEANMEAEAGLTLGVLAVVAKTPSVFGTHMGSAMSMMEALGSNELGGVMDFLFSMSLYNRHREIKSVFAFYVHITGVAVDTIVGRGGEGGRQGGVFWVGVGKGMRGEQSERGGKIKWLCVCTSKKPYNVP